MDVLYLVRTLRLRHQTPLQHVEAVRHWRLRWACVMRRRDRYDLDHFDHRPAAAMRAISLRLSGESLVALARPPMRAASPAAILAPMTEAAIASRDRFSPLGPLGIGPR